MSIAFEVIDTAKLNGVTARLEALRPDFYFDFTLAAIDAPQVMPAGATYRNDVSPDHPFGCPKTTWRR